MKMRWLAAGLTGVLILGGTMTIVQRAITQKTRGVLPEANDPAHGDSRRAAPVLALPAPATPPAPTPSAVDVAIATAPAEPALVMPPGEAPGTPAAFATTFNPTVAVGDPTPPSAPDQIPTPSAPVDLGPASPPVDPSVSVTLTPAASAPTLAPAPVAAPSPGPRDVLSDPVHSVESFVEQNRREADHAIQTLANEAENLKGRLAQVEVALARWQTFSRALNADLPPGSDRPTATGPAGSKGNWRTPAPESAARTSVEGAIDSPSRQPAAPPTEEPAPELTPIPGPTSPKASTTSPEPSATPVPDPTPVPSPTPVTPPTEVTAPPPELPPPGEAPRPAAPEPSAPPLDPAREAPTPSQSTSTR